MKDGTLFAIGYSGDVRTKLRAPRWLGRVIRRVQAELLAEEGYHAGLVWAPAHELVSYTRSSPGVIALIDEGGSLFHVEALPDVAIVGPRQFANFGWATEVSISVTSDLREALDLQQDIARRLAAGGRTPAPRVSPKDSCRT